MSLKIISVNSDFSNYGPMIQKLESEIEYPYGHDFFRIDHGPNYFAFFERLGEIRFNLAISGHEVVGCAAGILRTIPIGNHKLKCWYLCDLKVRKDFLSRRIPSKLFRKSLFRNYFYCSRAYAISMNPSSGENRIIKLLKRVSWLPFQHVENLNFYVLNYEEILDIVQQLKVEFGSDSFLSLEGKKDLIMKSDGQRMPLLHYQYGPFKESGQGPLRGAKHMFCAPADSKLDRFLSPRFKVQATASIIAHRMADVEWDFVLSSEI